MTRIMALADTRARLMGFRLLPGQAQDLRGTAALIEGLGCGPLLADRVCAGLAGKGIEAVIRPTSSRRCPAGGDREAEGWRPLVGILIARLKDDTGIAMRSGRPGDSFGALSALAATAVRLKGTSPLPRSMLRKGGTRFCAPRTGASKGSGGVA